MPFTSGAPVTIAGSRIFVRKLSATACHKLVHARRASNSEAFRRRPSERHVLGVVFHAHKNGPTMAEFEQTADATRRGICAGPHPSREAFGSPI